MSSWHNTCSCCTAHDDHQPHNLRTTFTHNLSYFTTTAVKFAPDFMHSVTREFLRFAACWLTAGTTTKGSFHCPKWSVKGASETPGRKPQDKRHDNPDSCMQLSSPRRDSTFFLSRTTHSCTVRPLLRAGPRNFIYHEMDTAPRTCLLGTSL